MLHRACLATSRHVADLSLSLLAQPCAAALRADPYRGSRVSWSVQSPVPYLGQLSSPPRSKRSRTVIALWYIRASLLPSTTYQDLGCSSACRQSPPPPRTDGNCCSCSSNCFQTCSVCRGRPMAKAGGSAAQIRNKKPPLGPSFSRFSPWPSRCSTRRRNRQTSKAVAALFDSLWSSCLVMVCRGEPWVAFAGTMLPTEPSMDPLSGH